MSLDCIESVAKIFFYIAAPLAAWAALFTWKRELKGKAKHEVAKEVLSLVVNLRSFLHWVQFRSKMVSSRKNIMNNYERLRDYFTKASELSIEVDIHWGNEESKLVTSLVNRLMDLDFIVSNYDPEDLIGEKTGIDKERVMEYLKVINGEDIEYNKETETILSDIERKFRKYVQ